MLIAGRYRLQTTIGRGAMGEVWRAYDETLGRAVAVKLLLAQNSDPTASSRFRLEAQTAGRLSHPHVVGVLDFGEQEGRLFLVMELVEGDSLARVLSQAGSLLKPRRWPSSPLRRPQGSQSHTNRASCIGTSSPATFSSTPTGP
ncbi:protein kinase [Streptomyces sp. S1D4-11]